MLAHRSRDAGGIIAVVKFVLHAHESISPRLELPGQRHRYAQGDDRRDSLGGTRAKLKQSMRARLQLVQGRPPWKIGMRLTEAERAQYLKENRCCLCQPHPKLRVLVHACVGSCVCLYALACWCMCVRNVLKLMVFAAGHTRQPSVHAGKIPKRIFSTRSSCLRPSIAPAVNVEDVGHSRIKKFRSISRRVGVCRRFIKNNTIRFSKLINGPV